MLIRILIICLFAHGSICAFTVRTLMHGNWEDASVWSNNQVPTSPDSVIVSHYITINQDLIIPYNAILLVDSNGTICGDYQMRTVCSNVYNYGYVYLNSLKISAHFYNYKVLKCKTSLILTACSVSQSGSFHNLPPNGTTSVWPPVLCKTPDTNWENGTVGLMEVENNDLKIFPNPIRNEPLTIITLTNSKLKLMDVLGNRINGGVFENRTEINFAVLPSGIYFLELEIDGKIQTKKIVKTD